MDTLGPKYPIHGCLEPVGNCLREDACNYGVKPMDASTLIIAYIRKYMVYIYPGTTNKCTCMCIQLGYIIKQMDISTGAGI